MKRMGDGFGPDAVPSRNVRAPGRGWADFTATILAIVGILNAIQGLTGLFKQSYLVAAGLVWENVGFWAIVWLMVGMAQIATASMLLGAEPWGRRLGIVFAGASIVVSFLSLGAYPFWHVVVIAIDVIIIYGLTTHAELFEEPASDRPADVGVHVGPTVNPMVPR